MRASIGTREWARQTAGRMGWTDRLAMLRQGVALQLSILAAGRAEGLDLDAVRIPDSQTARDAAALCRQASPQTRGSFSPQAF